MKKITQAQAILAVGILAFIGVVIAGIFEIQASVAPVQLIIETTVTAQARLTNAPNIAATLTRIAIDGQALSATPTATLNISTPVSASMTPTVSAITTPAAFIHYYFVLILILRDYADGWQLLTPEFQKESFPNGYAGYTAYWNGFQKVDIESIQVNQPTPSSADCSVVLTFHYTDGSTRSVIGTYHLIYNSTARTWMFDMP